MLAMDSRAPLGVRVPASSLTTIASVLAPTGGGVFDPNNVYGETP